MNRSRKEWADASAPIGSDSSAVDPRDLVEHVGPESEISSEGRGGDRIPKEVVSDS